MATARDTWFTTDPRDNGSAEAIDQIHSELRRELSDIREAADAFVGHHGERLADLLAAAFFANNKGAQRLAWETIDASINAQLRDRAIDIYNARVERELAIAADAQSWSDAA